MGYCTLREDYFWGYKKYLLIGKHSMYKGRSFEICATSKGNQLPMLTSDGSRHLTGLGVLLKVKVSKFFIARAKSFPFPAQMFQSE